MTAAARRELAPVTAALLQALTDVVHAVNDRGGEVITMQAGGGRCVLRPLQVLVAARMSRTAALDVLLDDLHVEQDQGISTCGMASLHGQLYEGTGTTTAGVTQLTLVVIDPSS